MEDRDLVTVHEKYFLLIVQGKNNSVDHVFR